MATRTNATKREAQKVERVVYKVLGAEVRESGNPMTLHEPGFHANGWTISFEGWRGEDDWPFLICEMRAEGLLDDLPEDVFLEPVASWCLGIYPA